MSILFADIRGSTALSERISATEFRRLISRFYSAATKAIIEEDGLVEKLAGDGLAAFWGPGFAGPDYVKRTFNVTRRLSKVFIQEEFRSASVCMQGWLLRTMSTADGLMNIAAVGEEVNLAARLASKASAGEIILSEQAHKQVGLDESNVESRTLELKGISQPVTVRVLRG